MSKDFYYFISYSCISNNTEMMLNAFKKKQNKLATLNSMPRYGALHYHMNMISSKTLNSQLIIHTYVIILYYIQIFSVLTIITYYVAQYPVKSSTSTLIWLYFNDTVLKLLNTLGNKHLT